MIINENNQKTFPIAALLLGATIWGVVWYPYRILEQYGVSGEIAATITFCIALLLGMIFFRRSIQFSSIFNGKAPLLF